MAALIDVQNEIHGLAVAKGWYNEPESEPQFLNRTCSNIHDEVSELHTAFREGNLWAPCDKAKKMAELGLQPLSCLEEELADIVIRAFDTAGFLKINLARAIMSKHGFNKTRPYRHGGKLS